MNYLSTFSGIEAASVAWHNLDWNPLAFSEVDEFASEVLKQRFNVPNLGDINDYRKWPEYDPQLIIGGSPCQSFSIAGLREGLDDPRGRLIFAYLGVVERYRPDWVIWENVTGVLSKDRGRAFGSLLGALDVLGYSVGWRVLDAGFWTPQSRPRVFVVGHRGADPRPVASVLALGEGQGVHFTENYGSEGGRERFWSGHRSTISAVTANYRKGVHCGGETYIRVGDEAEEFQDGHYRQMLPEEIEKLFGFPEGWTNIEWGNRKKAPKTRRYKALGNSMSVPVVRWLGRRIKACEDSWCEVFG